ncbi:MAG: hypothetical protein JXB04_03990 [Kiritimatiellae bacterium]|nr:hypothetical protein [Kiritimatiellia bacterium]
MDLALFRDMAGRAKLKGIQEWLSICLKSPQAAEGRYPAHDLPGHRVPRLGLTSAAHARPAGSQGARRPGPRPLTARGKGPRVGGGRAARGRRGGAAT